MVLNISLRKKSKKHNSIWKILITYRYYLGINKSNSWLHTGPPSNQTLSPRALHELQQLGAVLTALGSLFHAHHPLVKNVFLISNLTLPNLKACESSTKTESLPAGLCWYLLAFPAKRDLAFGKISCKTENGYKRFSHGGLISQHRQLCSQPCAESDPIKRWCSMLRLKVHFVWCSVLVRKGGEKQLLSMLNTVVSINTLIYLKEHYSTVFLW